MLLVAVPARYRNVYFHKQTKNTWARDDPAILVLIAACLVGACARPCGNLMPYLHAAAGIAWGLAYKHSPGEALTLAILMVLRDYLLTGVIIATILWYVLRSIP